VALARSLFRKGANFTAGMAFEIASTNLVAKLSIILIVLMSWRFALAVFVGAPIMVVLLVFMFRMFLKAELVREAKTQVDRGILGRMGGHAEMDMSVANDAPLWKRKICDRGLTAIRHYFVAD